MSGMSEVVLQHTGQLGEAGLQAVRDLLAEAFAGELTEHDVQHCLGGMHALVRDSGELVAHAALVQRTLLHGGRALRAGYVEGVAVRPDRRRAGLGGAVLAALEQLGAPAYDLLALSTTEQARGLYAVRGWLPWQGSTWVLAPDGPRRTPDDDDGVLVLPLSAELDLHGPLACDWREGDVW
jgi:aminoglycoside 2'-N-acetyltransferase I